ncbi:hypothetical protein PHMEG_0004274 [Phytophthora megakarya]|uniref:Apple domain-containing protein n=1 Tax=Phytophthora megakarya TaxID=4795 RepID=A0A225WU58_9STRA|nr:hypothetical protein PHMEG_0004274 [Phytophthora megakarya]
MLGIETPDSTSFRTRTELFTKQPVDCAVLTELLGPTEGDPFQFLGVTWMLYEHNWPLKAMVKPRDFVTLIATGTMTRACGDRIGYEVVQPARLSQCPPLPGAIVRGKVMYAAIFKQQEPGVVDIFVHTYVETQGVLMDKLVVTVTWKATIGFWDAPQLAEMKKLQWCIANCRAERQKEQQRASASALNASDMFQVQGASDTQSDRREHADGATSTGLTCGAQLKNIYYHGFNLQTSTVRNATACCDLCTAYDGCVLYTYFQSSSTGQSLCYLKSGAGEKTNYADSSSVTAVSAFMVSTTTPTPTSTPTPTTSTPSTCDEQLTGVFYNDYTLYEFSIDSADQCCEYCSQLAVEGCVLYTLYVSKSENVNRCLLKSAAGTTTNYTTSDDLTVVSAFLPASATVTPTPTSACAAEGEYCGNAQGTMCCESDSYCQPWNTYYYQCIGLPEGCGNLETDIDYYGNDLSSALTLYPWQCCSLCQATEGCNAYTFVNLDPAGPTCYLKTSSAGRVANVGALSGVPLLHSRV